MPKKKLSNCHHYKINAVRKKIRNASKLYGIGVVSYSASAESFFLKKQAFVEHCSTFFCRHSEIEVFLLEAGLRYDMVEKQIESSARFAFCICGYILNMHHPLVYKKQTSAEKSVVRCKYII